LLQLVTVSYKNTYLFVTVTIKANQCSGRPLIQDWCFQDRIPNATFDCVLMPLQHDDSTNAKLTESV